jgi:hypothetical protein
MNPPPSHSPMPLTQELELRLQALRKLRREMLALHARLEYLRLMLRIAGPALPQEPPQSDAR